MADRNQERHEDALVATSAVRTGVTINLEQPQPAVTEAAKKMAQVVASHS